MSDRWKHAAAVYQDAASRSVADLLLTRRELKAERAMRADLANNLDAVYRWLVEVLGFPLETRTEHKPAWLDIERLAEVWRQYETAGDEPLSAWVDLIYAETGWPREQAEGSCPE